MDRVKKIGWFVIGWLFILLGALGLFLPILQGILFIMIGLAILSSQSEWVRRLLKYMESRFPHLRERVEKLKGHFRDRFKNPS